MKQVKKQKCEGKRGIEVRKNGKLFKDRICTECGVDHWNGDNTCVACYNALHKKRYGYKYTKRKDTPWHSERQGRIAAHTERVAKETAAIEAAGLNIDEYSFEDVEKIMAGTLKASKARKVIENE